MPVAYEIDPIRKLIFAVCTDDLDWKEISDLLRDLERDPNLQDRMNLLLDLTEVASTPGTDQVRAVSDELTRHRPKLQFNACAIVASGEALFGMMRMFETFARDSFAVTEVFHVIGEAEAWLAAQETKPNSP